MPIQRPHDKFYTRAEVAQLCIQHLFGLEAFTDAYFIEPAAGAGAFLDLLPVDRCMGLDIEPAHPKVLTQDFLAYVPSFPEQVRRIAVVGNPPFGRNSNLALKFFNKAATFADVIAFILPKTFQKDYTKRKLAPEFHLVREVEIPDEAFIFEGEIWSVPCVFQIWVKKEVRRMDVIGPRNHPDFNFVKREHAQFAVRRVGRSAGLVLRQFAQYSTYSHHFLSAKDPERVMRVLESINWSDVRRKTAGVPCVGKEELVRLYEQHRNLN